MLKAKGVVGRAGKLWLVHLVPPGAGIYGEPLCRVASAELAVPYTPLGRGRQLYGQPLPLGQVDV